MIKIDFLIRDVTDLGIAQVLSSVLEPHGVDLALIAESASPRAAMAEPLAETGRSTRASGRYDEADAVLVTTVAAAQLDRWRGTKLLIADGCAPITEPHGDVRGIDGAVVAGRHARASLSSVLELEQIAMVGHPRLARYQRGQLERGAIMRELELDARRKTVVVFTDPDIPLPRFAGAVERLARTHQVILYGNLVAADQRRVTRLEYRPWTSEPSLLLAVADVSLAAVRTRFLGDAILAGGVTIALSAGDASSDRAMPMLLDAAPVCTTPDDLGRLIDELMFDDVYIAERAKLSRHLFEPLAGRADDAVAAALLAMLERIGDRSLVGAG